MLHRRGVGRLLVVLILAVVVVASTVVPLQASPDHGAALDESGAGGFIGLNPEGGLDTGGIISVGEPASTEEGTEPARPQYRIENGGDCIADEVENADGTIDPVLGTTWLTVLADEMAEGDRTIVDAVCAVEEPPPPPPPPSPDEVWQFVPLAEAGLGINPIGDGLTGLETWLWHEGAGSEVSVAPTLRGYDLVVEARPVLYRWDMGNGSVYSSPSPGSEDEPAATHVYETKGDYEVIMEVVWEGSYEFSGFGVSNSGSLGSVTVTRSRDYHVAEARAVRR